MATTTNAPPSALKHIYFFLEDAALRDSNIAEHTTSSHDVAKEPVVVAVDSAAPSMRSASVDSSSSGSTAVTKSTSASPLSAAAPEFVPFPPSQPQATPLPHALELFEARDIPGKGIGLVATQPIPRGARVICEAPLVRIVRNELYLVWEQYCRLNPAQKAQFDALHFYENKSLNFEQASRTHLLDPSDKSMESDDEDEAVSDHIRVMGIFSANNFIIANNGLAVFATASRLNHSCIPNVYHSYNPSLKMETIHALRDIMSGEELQTNYVGEKGHFWTRIQRWEMLRSNYGFTCSCSACSDHSGINDATRMLLSNIIIGLEKYQNGIPKGNDQFIPASPYKALAQSEDIVRLLLDQDLIGLELAKAYRIASTQALEAKDFNSAVVYACDERTVERNIMGTEVDDLKKKGAASEVWIQHVYNTVKAENYRLSEELYVRLMGPSKTKAAKEKSTSSKEKSNSPKKKSGWQKKNAKKHKAAVQPAAIEEKKRMEKQHVNESAGPSNQDKTT